MIIENIDSYKKRVNGGRKFGSRNKYFKERGFKSEVIKRDLNLYPKEQMIKQAFELSNYNEIIYTLPDQQSIKFWYR